ncbi:MAG: 2-iminobutanoate/2-iminopropanoate deaminase [Roseivirga sp.]
MEKIVAQNAPKALGPYASAVKTGHLIFCSGQTGINPETGKVDKTCVEGQTKQVMKNLKAVLAAHDLTLQHIVKCNVYLSDMANFEKMNVVYGEMLEGHTPARTTVAVAGLPLNALVEIECVAEC